VLNVAGHRIGTMEVESALVDHPRVAEAAVVGRAHEIKGQAITAFVTLKEGQGGSLPLIDELKAHVAKKIGAIARPEEILFTADRRPRPRRHDDAGRSECRVEAERQIRRGSPLRVVEGPQGARYGRATE
jgi:acyl-CoA synthetase (AMP-forming)/AMP-acid ligase II